MYKKITASLMAALMTLVTIVSPVLATDLKDFPSFLLTTDKALDAYVVVGSAAATSDVAGAVDLAVALAQAAKKSETKTTTGTTQAVEGTERKISIPATSTAGQIGGSTANNLPAHLYTYHYSGLKEGQYEYKGTKHNYKELVVLPTAASSTPQMTHKLSDPVNGTLKMKVDASSIAYKFQFLDSIADFGIATSANTTTYQNPVKVTVAGKELQVVAVVSTASFRALAGSVGWIEQGSKGLTTGDLSVEVTTVYSGTQAALKIVDASGNLVKDLGVVDTSTQTFTYGGSSYSVKVLNTATVSVAGAGNNRAQIAFAKGDVDKLFDGSETATVSDWGSDWKVSGQFATAGLITANDNITVTYNPSSLAEASKYYEAGSIFYGPGKYFEMAYAGLDPSKVAKVTIEPVTGKTVYNSTLATGAVTSVSNLNGLKLSTDVSGSVVDSGNTGRDEVYVLFNTTQTASTFVDVAVWLAYYDKTTSRLVQITPTVEADGLLASVNAPNAMFNFTLSYGGPGATSTFLLNGTYSASTLIGNMLIAGTANETVFAYRNRTVSTSGASVELILGSGASTADANDVTGKVEGTQQDLSAQLKGVITDGGIQLYTVKSNVESNKVVVGIPPETVYAKIQFGKTSAATAGTTYTTDTVVPITAAVAKLDSEVTATEKTKNLVLVGGPCKNTLTAELAAKSATDALPTCATWPGSNFAVIMLFDNAYTTGKTALVVAGTRAEDTRLGTSVLQDYNIDPVKGKLTGTSIKVTGATVSTATIAAA